MSGDLQNRLLNYEAQPSNKVWQEIDAALDIPHTVQEKLFHFQQVPQAAVWSNINNHLNNVIDVPVLPGKGLQPVYRYMTAAAVLLVLSLGVLWFFNKQFFGNMAQNAQSNGVKEPPSTSGKAQQPRVNATENQTAYKSGLISEDEKRTSYETTNKGNLENIYRTSAIYFASMSPSVKPKTIRPKKKIIVQNNAVDKYMIYSSSSGSVVKLPKKLYDLFSCATDPNTAQADWCKQNMQTLQQKMVQKAPPSSDFAAMLDMLKYLQEN